MLIISSNKNPILSTQDRYYKNKEYEKYIHENINYETSGTLNYDIEIVKNKIKEIILLSLNNNRETLKDVRKELLQ